MSVFKWAGKGGLLCAFLVGASVCAAQPVFINEVMPANVSVFADEDGTYADWFELYNPATDTLDLSGYGLSDRANDLFQWVMPNLKVAPKAYTLFFASGKDRPGGNVFWETVLDRGDDWQYRLGTSEPPADWTDPGFDGASWSVGPSGFGYGDEDDATIVTRTVSLYIRAPFTVSNPDQIASVFLHVDYDDGFVAYLNGVEIARANMGSAGSRPTFDQRANNVTEPLLVQGLPLAGFSVDDLENLLQPGENVLAVQVHNFDINSSDLTILPFLTLGYSTPPAGGRGPSQELDFPGKATPHTNFKLSASGETLFLTAPSGLVVDSVRAPAMPSDHSFGRKPDGGGTWVIFEEPTPEASNETTGFEARAPAPDFSRLSGAFDIFAELSLTTGQADATIRYTLNGATPTETSRLFRSVILLTATTVVRARVYQPGLLPGPVVTQTYLKDEPFTLPVLSLVTDPPNLWDYETGIYVLGPGAESQNPNYGANFWQDWEIPVDVALFEQDGQVALETQAGAAIFGGWSRAHAQKSIVFKARNRYGATDIPYPLFPDKPYGAYGSFILRNSGNDWNTSQLRDAFMHRLVEDTAIDNMAYRPAIVYLNGEYWGILNLREKINEHYASVRANVDPDQIDLLELDGEPLNGSSAHYEDLIRYIEQNSLSDPDAYQEVERRMDLDNYIDYQAAQIYFDNTDWPGNNIKFWRPQTPEGRWRWILFDTDFGFGLYEGGAYNHNTMTFATDRFGPEWPNPPWSTFLLRSLLTNESFKQAFLNRFADLLNVHFEPGRVVALLDTMAAAIAPEIPRHMDRWGGSVSSWEGEISKLRTFGRFRQGVVFAHLLAYFSLPGVSEVSLNVEGGGMLRINREQIRTFPWKGQYFKRIPVTVSALPNPGFRFVRWSGDVEGTDAVITIDPAVAATLVAHFEVDTGARPAVVINEILYHAAPDMDGEDWVELYNAGPSGLDLSGWRFGDEDPAHRVVLPANTSLPTNGYLVLCRDAAAFSLVYPGVSCVTDGWGFGLGNSGDVLSLYDAAGVLVDSLAYLDTLPWPAQADGDGASLELRDAFADNRVPEAWGASPLRGGTPGRPNAISVGNANEVTVPTAFALHPSAPNPFSDQTTLYFSLSRPGEVRIRVYDAIGRLLETIEVGVRAAAAEQTLVWTPRAGGSGLFFFQLLVDGVPRGTVSAVRIP